MGGRGIAVLVLVAVVTQSVNALFFHLTEGQRRCFIEEVPEETLVQATYKSLDHQLTLVGGGEPTIIRFDVLDPNGGTLLSRDAEADGHFGFTSAMGGEHLICISTTTKSLNGQVRTFRFSLAMDYGEAATDYTEIAQREHLSAIEVEIRKLNDKIRGVRGEQSYQREREEAFRNTSESTNARVMWWSILQTIVLLVSGVWQIDRLKRFFRDKARTSHQPTNPSFVRFLSLLLTGVSDLFVLIDQQKIA